MVEQSWCTKNRFTSINLRENIEIAFPLIVCVIKFIISNEPGSITYSLITFVKGRCQGALFLTRFFMFLPSEI